MRKRHSLDIFVRVGILSLILFAFTGKSYSITSSSALECAQATLDGGKILQKCEHPESPTKVYTEKSAYDINTLSPVPSHTIVLPEVPTVVEMSSSDVNRLICPERLDVRDVVTDVVFSKEKGVITKVVGRNVFVKFKILKKDDQEIYPTTPTEMYVICGDVVYNIIAVPKRIPAKTVALSLKIDKIKKNVETYGAMPFEKRVLSLIRTVYREEIPDTFTVIVENKKLNIFKDIDLTHTRTVVVEGEGLRLKEYTVAIKDNKAEITLKEKDFLTTEITTKPVAISLSKTIIRKGESVRVFIVEQGGV